MLRWLVLLFALLPTPAEALEIRTGGIVAIQQSDHVPDDLLAIAGTVSILGRVDGDVYALGQLVAVGGQIGGDVIAVGQELRLGGRIDGNVRALGDAVQVLGTVERSVLAAGRQLRLQPGAGVGGSWTGWAEDAFLGGPIGRALWLTASSVRIDGAITGSARVHADRLTLGPAARFPDGLEYWSPADATIDPGAQAAANVTRYDPRPSRELARIRELATGAGRLLTIALLASSLVASLLVGLVAPRAAGAAGAVLSAQPWRALALGLAVLVAAPPVALLLGLTVLGLPLAATLLGMACLGLGVGWLLTAGAVATFFDRLGRTSSTGNPALLAIAGAALLWLAGQVPIVGTIVTLLAAVLGTGSLLVLLRRARLGA